MKLAPQFIEKPWGRTQLPPVFHQLSHGRIGELRFGAASSLPLLAKYLFTSERLSVQVHPNDDQARLRGLALGKAECWYIVDAEPGATIGLGLRCSLSRDQLRSAALDGSILEFMEWWPVTAGDFFYVPAGTIHAIGGGICLLEFQQNSDATYRLYDYGRPRELHLNDGVAIANLAKYPEELFQHLDEDEDRVLVDGPIFSFVHAHSDALQGRKRWILPVVGAARCSGEIVSAGECLLADAHDHVEMGEGWAFVGAAGSRT